MLEPFGLESLDSVRLPGCGCQADFFSTPGTGSAYFHLPGSNIWWREPISEWRFNYVRDWEPEVLRHSDRGVLSADQRRRFFDVLPFHSGPCGGTLCEWCPPERVLL